MNKEGFIFISNGTKPDSTTAESLAEIGPDSFSRASLYAANQIGWRLHMGINRNHPKQIGSKELDIKFYNQHCYRNIFAINDNLKAYRNLCDYLKDNPNIEVIHCNTPIGGVVGRLAGRKFKKKVIYTAHGFHFFKGAPLFNRTILKWIEQWLAHYTDILITINGEDYEAAQKFKLKKNGSVIFVPGVGIDLNPYNQKKNSVESQSRRSLLGLSDKDTIGIVIGDLNCNKNAETIIRAIQKVDKDFHLLICGVGPLKDHLLDISEKLDISERCHFLGYRKDVLNLLSISDMFIMASQREGLPRSTMEAMAMGLPCICSDIRGNRDLIDENKGGFLIPPKDALGFANAISTLIENPTLASQMGEYNKDKIKQFDIELVKKQMLEIFKHV